MRIILINTLYPPRQVGGAERSVQELAESLLTQGYDVRVVCLGPGQGVLEREHHDVPVYEVGIRNLYWPFSSRTHPLKPAWHAIDTYNPAMRRTVSDLLETLNPDLVHTNNLAGFSVSVWDAAGRLEVPVIHTLRDYYLLCPKATMFKNGRNCFAPCVDCSLYSVLRKARSSRVQHLVGISQFILDRHLKSGAFAYADTSVIPNSYSVCAAPQLQKATPTFGFLGRLEPAKGIEYALDVLTSLDTDWRISVAGSGKPEYTAYLQERFSDPRIQFLGHVDTATLLESVDVLLVPSLWHEPFGRVVIEAFAHGIPVIGSNRGGIPELVDEGKTGFIFDPEQPRTLQRGIERFLLQPSLAAQMQAMCLAKARDFLPSRVTKDYIDIYQATLERTATANPSAAARTSSAGEMS